MTTIFKCKRLVVSSTNEVLFEGANVDYRIDLGIGPGYIYGDGEIVFVCGKNNQYSSEYELWYTVEQLEQILEQAKAHRDAYRNYFLTNQE